VTSFSAIETHLASSMLNVNDVE